MRLLRWRGRAAPHKATYLDIRPRSLFTSPPVALRCKSHQPHPCNGLIGQRPQRSLHPARRAGNQADSAHTARAPPALPFQLRRVGPASGLGWGSTRTLSGGSASLNSTQETSPKSLPDGLLRRHAKVSQLGERFLARGRDGGLQRTPG